MTIKIEKFGEKISVKSPYHPMFADKIYAAGGLWEPSNRSWVIDAGSIDTVRQILRDVYYEDDFGGEKVDIRVTVGDISINAFRDCFTLYGRVIATASLLDSEARLGEKARFISGQPVSSRSARNMSISITAGSVFEIYDVPVAALDAEIPKMSTLEGIQPLYSIDIISATTPDDETLKAERARLIARIAVIDETLTKNERTV